MSLRDQFNSLLSRIEDAIFNSSMFDGNSQALIARIRQDAANIPDVHFINAEAEAEAAPTSNAQAAPEVVQAPAAPAVDAAPEAAPQPAPVTPVTPVVDAAPEAAPEPAPVTPVVDAAPEAAPEPAPVTPGV
jgi:hypothetical protein